MKQFCSKVLVVLMIITLLPMSVFAAGVDSSNSISNFTVIDNDQSTLAPGVILDEYVLYNSNNQRVEMYVTTVDTAVDTVQVKANYLNNQNAVYGMQTLSEQVACMEKNYPEPFKIVAGINASYYNTTTGKPTGAFVMEGIDVTTESEGNNFAFFAVLKDGTYMIGAKGEYSSYKGQIQEAIGGYIHIVKDGAVVSGLDKATLYPRQTLGLTADGKIILMTADGSQAPTTVGTTVHEQAEIMKALGCVEAIHLDGGNSATFGIIPEGSDKFVTKNSPSGGAERAVSNTLMIISTAVADGTFDHAVINGDYEYYAPHSTYTFTAFGVDATNASADIPETAVWTLSDDTFGTIKDGEFVSNGKEGTVAIQMSDNGKVVGSKTITIVDPTSASFALEETTVPYGKTSSLEVTALYGNFSIYTDENHYDFVVNPAVAGTMDGFEFTAAEDESVKSAVVKATYKYADAVTDSITVKFGKGSEVLFNFEDGDISDWKGTEEFKEWREEYNKNNPPYQLYDPDDYSNGIDKQTSSVFLATKENGGKVKNGDYALGFRMNHLQITDVAGWIYNYLYYTGDTKTLRDVANGKTATRIGMWVYSPDITNVAFRIVRGKNTAGNVGISYNYMVSDYDGKNVSYATNYGIPEAGWIYIYYNLTDLADNVVQTTSISGATLNGISPEKDYFPAFLQLFTGSATDTMSDMIFYIDDITLDYSDVTEDRDAPTISETTVCYDTANFVALNGQTVNNNLLSFAAKVSDVSGNSNATGLDYTTAKIYVDGMDMSNKNGFKAASGNLSLTDVYLTNGQHDITFVIFDNQGNESRVTKSLTVNGTANNSVVSVIGHNDGNNVPKAGSVYYIDIKASQAKQIKEIVTKFRLNSANTFEYDNVVCAEGVDATVKYDAVNFEVSVSLTHDGTLSGESVLASIPVRVWSWDEEYTGISSSDQFKTTAIPVIDIECKTLYGKVTYVDGSFDNYVCGFSGKLDVETELDNKTEWHVHNAVAMNDLKATCTHSGYTGRTYCEGCASVVDWGKTLDALGHDWLFNEDGTLVCANGGELFTGVYTDGKTYINGVVIADGWLESGDKLYYYVNGVVLTGTHFIDGKMYTFDDSGMYLPNYIHDGWYDVGDSAMYFVNNSYVTGCMIQNHVPYYFDDNGLAFDGEYIVDGKKCIFDNGCFSSCENENVIDAGWCGSDLLSVEYMVYADGTIRITGEGDMMDFETVHVVYWTKYVQKFINSIFIGKDITSIGDQAFRNCFFVSSITFEEGSKLENIGVCSFYNVRRASSVVLPETVKSLAWGAFGYNSKLSTIYLPDGIETINANAFVTCPSTLVLKVAEDTVAYKYAVKNNFKYELRDRKPVLLYSGSCGENATWSLYNDGKLVIGGSGAMTDYANRDVQPWAAYRNDIKEIVIGKDITHLGKFAFAYSYNVESFTFEEGSKLNSIGSYAIFYMYRYLTDLELPDSVTTIAGQAIAYNAVLENVYMPQNVSYVVSNVFANSPKVVLNVAEGTYAERFAINNNIDYITRAFIPNVVASGNCGENATWTLYERGKLVIGGSGAMTDYANRDAQPWAAYRNDIKEIVIGKDITHLGKFAFAYSYNVESITFEEGSKLNSIGSFAIFYMYRYLTNLELPDSVTTIAGQAIAYNTALVNVRMPQFASYIATNVFLKSTNVVLNVAEGTYAESFAISNSIAYTVRECADIPLVSGDCGENATWELYEDGKLVIGGNGAMSDFANKDAQPWAAYRNDIKEIVIGKDITHLGKFAFAYSYNVESITFEEGSKLNSIGSFAIFYMYRNLTELTLPESVERIAGQAIGYNTVLANVYIPQGVTSIADNAFIKSTNVVLNVEEGSYAENFATKNNISYIVVG